MAQYGIYVLKVSLNNKQTNSMSPIATLLYCQLHALMNSFLKIS